MRSWLEIYNQLFYYILFTFLYDFLTSKAVKCFVCFEDSDQESINPILMAFGVIFFILVVLITCRCFKTDGKLCTLFCDKLKCCGEFVRCCVTCQYLRECSCLSCDDCNCNDICRPCGECCIRWAGCCTTLVSRADGHSAGNHSDNVATEMSAIPEASGSTAAITSVSDFEEPPPSYNSINGKIILRSFNFLLHSNSIHLSIMFLYS